MVFNFFSRKIENKPTLSYNLSIVEKEKRSPYKEFASGDALDLEIRSLSSDGGAESTKRRVVIENIKGGGFFGTVLIPRDEPFVIKTSLPDPWHHLWRTVNWDFREFPAQSDPTSAQLEHLATRIIHNVLPAMSDKRFYAPDSLGYTRLPTGWAQVIEKVNGRPPRFDTQNNEYKTFKEAQKELSELCFKLGFEQVGQVHPDNPFGMANIWFDEEKRRFIWFDTIPAIPHRGFVWPFFRFKFHDEIKAKLGNGNITFNRIHTDRLMGTVWRNKNKFHPDVFKQVVTDVSLYQRKLSESQLRVPSLDKKSAKQAVKELSRNFIDGLTYGLTLRFLPGKIRDAKRFLTEKNFRDEFILSGVIEARKHNVITDRELEEAKQTVENMENDPVKRKLVIGLTSFYFGMGRIADGISAYILGLSIAENELLLGITRGVIIEVALPAIMDYIGTLAAGKLSSADLKRQAIVSIFPILRYGVPTIILASSSSTNIAWHYTVRKAVADVSRIHPAGGYGTGIEGKLYQKIGKRIEKLGKSKTSK